MLRNPLIIGKNGQLSRALQAVLPQATVLGSDRLDLRETRAIPTALADYEPDILFNAAAYTAVDKAEEEEQVVHQVNAEAPAMLAAFCKERDIPLIHYSTDYVFDGSGESPWRESDEPSPINAYGRSKLKGEQLVLASHAKALILRTSWVYDAVGSNFFTTMLRLAQEREELRVVNDQIGCPTYAPHLAKYSLQAAGNALQSARFPTGLYHFGGGGEPVSWHGFAEAIFDAYDGPLAVRKVHSIPTTDYPTPAPRPLNSRLNGDKAREILGVSLPDWREGLRDCLQEAAKRERFNK